MGEQMDIALCDDDDDDDDDDKADNVYGAVIVARATARVHPVHVMNMARHQAAACRLPEATPTIAIYYYYSTRKLILIFTF